MALIEGFNLAEHIASGDFAPSRTSAHEAQGEQRKIASLIRTLALAAHHAHQRGVIHRDLKPANVLFDSAGEPRIADFGLARQLDSESLCTASSKLAGTPAYMAPEQTRLNSTELTTGVDIYALGAILYELLTGRPPFIGETPLETIRQLVEEEPGQPRSLHPLVDADLAVICLKCIEKEPTRRYESAAALAEDLYRWLEGRPIEARPAAQVTRLIKWSRRRPAIASLSVFSIVALLAFIVLLIVSRQRIEERRQFAETQTQLADGAAVREQKEKDRLRRLLNRLDFDRAEALLQKGETSEAFAYLAYLVRNEPSGSVVRDRLHNALLHHVTVVPAAPAWRHPGGVNRIAFTPDGSRVATVCSHGEVQIHTLRTGETTLQFRAHSGLTTEAAFDPSGGRLLTASEDKTARVWDAETGEPFLTLKHRAAVNHAEFSHDGNWIVTASNDRQATRWSSETGEPFGSRQHQAPVSIARFSPNDSLIASASKDGAIKIGPNTSHHENLLELKARGGSTLSFSPDSLWVAAGSLDGFARVWQAKDGLPVAPPLRHDGAISWIAFSNGGKRLGVGGSDKMTRVWSLPSGELAFPPIKHKTEVVALEFSSDDSLLATTSWGRTSQLWNANDGRRASQEFPHSDWIRATRFSPGGGFVVTVSADRTAQLWRLLEKRDSRALSHGVPLQQVAIHEASETLVSRGRSSGMLLWNLTATTSERFLESSQKQSSSMAVSEDGNLIAGGFHEGAISLWKGVDRMKVPFQSGETVFARSLRFSPEGTLLAAGFQNGALKIWSLRSPTPPLLTFQLKQPIARIAFSPDGRRLAAAASGTGKLALVSLLPRPAAMAFYPPTPAGIRSLVFHPGGDRILTACVDRRARVFDAADGTLLSDAFQHDDQVYEAIYSPRADRIATVSKDGSARVWDAETGRLIGQPMIHESGVMTATFSPDGALLATGTRDGVTRVWNLAGGHPIAAFGSRQSAIIRIAFVDSGARLLSAGEDGYIRIHSVNKTDAAANSWLPDLAETIGGLRLDENRLLQPVSRENYWTLLGQALKSPLGESFRPWLEDGWKEKGQ
jgi:eukaryotic-like serine/threonine-protein kinase